MFPATDSISSRAIPPCRKTYISSSAIFSIVDSSGEYEWRISKDSVYGKYNELYMLSDMEGKFYYNDEYPIEIIEKNDPAISTDSSLSFLFNKWINISSENINCTYGQTSSSTTSCNSYLSRDTSNPNLIYLDLMNSL